MVSYKLFLEKNIRNRLRKQHLKDSGVSNYAVTDADIKKLGDEWDWAVLTGQHGDDEYYKDVRNEYLTLLKVSKTEALKYINDEKEKFITNLKTETLDKYMVKILDYQGIQVFIDPNTVVGDFSVGTRYYRHVENSVKGMVNYLKDILPIKKPRILITDLEKYKYTKHYIDPEEIVSGMASQDIIYIDQYASHIVGVYVHEYAHWLAFKASNRSKGLLINAYKELLNIYYEKLKKKKIKPEDSVRVSRRVLDNLSKKLNFPEYGTQNPDELFAMIIEYWKKFPINSTTYRFKTIAKKIITQL